MSCRGLRGATTVSENRSPAILAATEELLRALMAANDLRPADIASAIFTTTPDLCAAFPAQAARKVGWTGVPLLDAVEVAVPDALPCCIRVLIHWNTNRPPEAIRHIYLHGAACLRPDLAQPESEDMGREPDVERSREATAGRGQPSGRQSSPPIYQPENKGAHAMHQVVAYQGEPGAYSQEAIFQHFGGEVEALACPSFDAIFAAVEEGRAAFGLLPVENSQTGSIHQSYDLLLDRDLRVVGEVKYRVRHCLLAPAGTSIADIQRVRSHPQALAQVERYLRRRGWQAVPAYDTAGAARELAAAPEPGTAAIASALAGQIYDLQALEQGIEDAFDNTTRFFVISRDAGGTSDANAHPYKTSLVFATAHAPGSLYRALGEFASRGLNLTKIESRPRRNRPWHYVFYLDFEGHSQDASVQEALVALLSCAAYVKLLGSYPAAE